ncbi:MAG: sugar ABC transporter ATP-binding protein [Clostridiales Family XIII bacterium]|jgi:ribose transport system ATP-binding protein|nr:sugar ABC transporter ATP-binding protein [Clostridiales Family XIII bacterium]
MTNANNILEIRGLYKSFGTTRANINIDFNLKKGEIRGLIGENGSGKSTLLSQIAGIYHRDSGEVLLNGEPYDPVNAVDANSHGISMVVQELGVVGTLPAYVNVYLGRTSQFTKGGIVSLETMKKAAEEVFTKWELPYVQLTNLTDGLMIETRKIIELARALSVDPDILILDEITQSLSHNTRQNLYKLIGKFRELGKSMIIITHDVEEMLEITDTITVLRDGEFVGEVVSADTDADTIKRMMVGREISGEYYRADKKPDYKDNVILAADNINIEGEVKDLSFELHEGEILGFCGLADSGIHAVGQAIYGLAKLSGGAIRLNEENVEITNPTKALRQRMAYVPKDRDHEALMIHANILDNSTLPSLTELQIGPGFLPPKLLSNLADGMTKRLSVKAKDIHQTMDSLSGGNKQKVNLGRWLAKDLKVLVLDCPTRGVDVGVKAYIYELMREAKTQGIATILISDELTEVLGMADRLIVMKDGEQQSVIRRDEDFTEQSVIGVMI